MRSFLMFSGRPSRSGAIILTCVVNALLIVGCSSGPAVVPPQKQTPIDRSIVEFPADLTLTLFAKDLTAPSSLGFVTADGPYKGSLIVAESGEGDYKPQIYGFKPDGERFWIYPLGNTLPLFGQRFRIYGPVGGMAVKGDRIFVSHRDENDLGMITAFDLQGKHSTLVADMPTLGDGGLTDVAVHPINGRLYFGVGAATNSGVVGLDNWLLGWVDQHPGFADRPLSNLKLNGYRFTTVNPRGGLFGGDDIAVSGPFQPFGASRQIRITGSPTGKPTAAIYSIDSDGGDLRVEAHGIRMPRGFVFNEFGNLFVSNNGMELRGTRPVKDDPDAVLRVPLGGQVWFGWPDYSADLRPVGQESLQPPREMIIKTGYPELAAVVDHEGSNLIPPDRAALLRAVFPSMSGAAKMAFVDDSAAERFKAFRGSVLIALSGDRAPFATSGQPLRGAVGYRVVRVDLDNKKVEPFVFNTKGSPASWMNQPLAIERPIDLKFGPDGALYILDFGQMEVRATGERIKSRSGRIFRLGPPNIIPPTPAASRFDN